MVFLSGPYLGHAAGALLILGMLVVVIGAAIRRAEHTIAAEVDAAEQRLRDEGRP